MAKQSFIEHKPVLESALLSLAVRGLQSDKIEGEALRKGMRTEVSAIVNKTPFGMFDGMFKAFFYDPYRASNIIFVADLGLFLWF